MQSNTPLIVKFFAFSACLNHSMIFKSLSLFSSKLFALMFVIIYATFPFLHNVMRSLYLYFSKWRAIFASNTLNESPSSRTELKHHVWSCISFLYILDIFMDIAFISWPIYLFLCFHYTYFREFWDI